MIKNILHAAYAGATDSQRWLYVVSALCEEEPACIPAADVTIYLHPQADIGNGPFASTISQLAVLMFLLRLPCVMLDVSSRLCKLHTVSAPPAQNLQA